MKLLLKYHEKDKKMALENLGDAFRIAAQKQNLELVQLILEVAGPDIIHSRGSTGWTALHQSCTRSDDTEVMEFLLASGAKVNAVIDTFGETPLFRSIDYVRLECAKVLLAAGAAVNHRRTDGRTPLDQALAKVDYDGSTNAARAKIVEVLKAAGALTATQLPDDDDGDGEA